MVIKDLYSSDEKRIPQLPILNLAPPVDRMLASFLDLLFHSPIFALLSSAILYRLNLLKLTISTTTEKMAVFGQLVWIVLVGTIILQSIYLKLWKKTPGMRLFKLELQSLNNTDLSWGQCLLRSTVWSFEILFMGIPLLEIFSHPKRHALHDRISETEVRTQKQWGAHAPMPSEKSTVQVVFTCVLMLGLGWMTAIFSGVQKGITDGSIAMAEWRDQSRLCSQVDEVSTYSDVDLTDLKNRIDFGLSLFFLEQIDADCVRKEVDLAVIKGVSGPLPWVGRALLSTAFSQERQNYVIKACTEDARWCTKTLFQEKGSLADAKEILKGMTGRVAAGDSLSYSTAKLILLNRLGAADKASQLIDTLQSKGIRATGLVAEQLRAVSRTNPERMPSVIGTLKSVMVEKDYMRLNSDLCLRQLEAGCGGKVAECDTMISLLPKYKDSLSDLVVSRALFKTALCKKDLTENMEYWTLITSEGLQKLVRLAMQMEKESTQSTALAKLRTFVKNESEKNELRLDALQLLLSRSNFAGDWKLVSYFWNQLDWTQASYLSASEWLMRETRKNRNKELVLSLGKTFAEIPGLKIEWGLLNQKSSERLPASVERNNR